MTWNLVLVLNVTQPLSLPLWCRWCRDMKCSSYNVECEVLLLYMCLLCKHRNNKHTVAYSLYMISLWAALATVVELYIHFRMYNILLSTGTFSARCLLFCCFFGRLRPVHWCICVNPHLETYTIYGPTQVDHLLNSKTHKTLSQVWDLIFFSCTIVTKINNRRWHYAQSDTFPFSKVHWESARRLTRSRQA